MTVTGLSRQTVEICETDRQPGREAPSVADEELLWLSQARDLLSAEVGYPVSEDSVRAYADGGHLKVIRPPSAGPGHSRRRIGRASVIALAVVMKMPAGPERIKAMAQLRVENSAE